MDSTGQLTSAKGRSVEKQGREIAATTRLVLLLAATVLMIADMALIFLWVPTEEVMGVVQRIMYFHVPLAWVGFLTFFVVFCASALYLWKGQRRWDAVAQRGGAQHPGPTEGDEARTGRHLGEVPLEGHRSQLVVGAPVGAVVRFGHGASLLRRCKQWLRRYRKKVPAAGSRSTASGLATGNQEHCE